MSEKLASQVSSSLSEIFDQAHRIRPLDCSDPDASGRASASMETLWQDVAKVVPVTDLGPTTRFSDALRRRCSRRQLERPTVDEVGLVVARAGLTRHGARNEAGLPISARPAPSAGARQPLTLVVLVHDVEGLPAGSWVLDSDAAVLRPGDHSSADIFQAMGQISDAMHVSQVPPAVVLIVGRPQLTLSRYPDGISLLWREVGALQMLIHLAATDIGLGSCLVGTCAALYPATGNPNNFIDLGAVALGRVDTSTTRVKLG